MPRITLSVLVGAAVLSASCGSSTSPTAPSNVVSFASIAPSSGTTFGGTRLTLSGANFTSNATVTIGGAPATDVSVVSPSLIMATTAQHKLGPVVVTVSSGGKTAIMNNGFNYVSPGPINNTPPTILSLGARGTRFNEPFQFADLNEAITVTAVVQDAETPVQQLTYEWSSNAGGTFTGSGAVVTWRASAATGNATLTVTVIERYNDADPVTGLPIPKENRVSRSTIINVHDSVKEIGDMARQFLLDFSDSTIRDVNFILRNFTTTCPDRASEFDDISSNRQHFRITASSIGSAAVTVNFGGVCPFRVRFADACAQVPSEWFSIFLDNGSKQHVAGTDQVTARYLQNEGGWKLCGSDFDGVSVAPLRYTFIR